MKITFPHMGNLSIVARVLFESIGQTVIVPPPITKRTLQIGSKYSPEGACLPFKINLGNFIESAELGADTIVLTGGCGPCRFGYYGEVHREILRDLGYNFEMVVLEVNEKGLRDFNEKVKFLANGASYLEIAKALRLAWHKAKALDTLEEAVQQVRACEALIGTCDKLFSSACKRIDEAKNILEINAIMETFLSKIRSTDRSLRRDIIRIAIVGEIYTILEPFASLNMEKHLGKMGVQTIRSLYLSQWANDHMFKGLLRARSSKKAIAKAVPFLSDFVGGHAMETVGSAILFSECDYDGVIQVAPLTCMPEIVAQSIIPYYASKHHLPFMTIYVDEQSGEAGLITRLEAFCDLVRQKKKSSLKESV